VIVRLGANDINHNECFEELRGEGGILFSSYGVLTALRDEIGTISMIANFVVTFFIYLFKNHTSQSNSNRQIPSNTPTYIKIY
jgi:hypothetical protein